MSSLRVSCRTRLAEIFGGIAVIAIATTTIWVAASGEAPAPSAPFTDESFAEAAGGEIGNEAVDEFPGSAAAPVVVPRLAAATTLLDAGSEPRSTVRLSPTVGSVQTFVVTQSGDQTLTMTGQGAEQDSVATDFPTIVARGELRVTAVEPGRISVSASLPRPDVAPPAGREPVDPQVASETESLAETGDSTRSQLDISRRGEVRSGPVLLGDIDDALLVTGFVERDILALADPLPSEPIGVGARWSVASTVNDETIPTTITTTYQITEISSSLVRASLYRTVDFASVERDGTRILDNSRLAGTGDAVWPLGGAVGMASYTLGGAVAYELGDRSSLLQDMTRRVETTWSLSVAPPPATNPPTTTAPAANTAAENDEAEGS